MNLGIRTVAAQFLFWKYLFRIFGIVSLQCRSTMFDEICDNCSEKVVNSSIFYSYISEKVIIPEQSSYLILLIENNNFCTCRNKNKSYNWKS
jgi:hypothetical protein